MRQVRDTLLLVEDDSNDILLFKHHVQRVSQSRGVHAITSAEEAIAYLEGQNAYADRELFPLPSLVLVDLKLPGMNGFELLTWIRQQPRFKRLQVVILTASKNSIDVYRAYELGASSFIAKPIGREDLQHILQARKFRWSEVLGGYNASEAHASRSLPS